MVPDLGWPFPWARVIDKGIYKIHAGYLVWYNVKKVLAGLHE